MCRNAIIILLYVCSSLYAEEETCETIIERGCSRIWEPVCALLKFHDWTPIPQGEEVDNNDNVDYVQAEIKAIRNMCELKKRNCSSERIADYHVIDNDICGLPSKKVLETPTRRDDPTGTGIDPAIDMGLEPVIDHSVMGAYSSCNHSCPISCPDIYEPLCVKFGDRGKLKPIINHCHVDLLSCSLNMTATIRPHENCMPSPRVYFFMKMVAQMKSLKLFEGSSLDQELPQTRRRFLKSHRNERSYRHSQYRRPFLENGQNENSYKNSQYREQYFNSQNGRTYKLIHNGRLFVPDVKNHRSPKLTQNGEKRPKIHKLYFLNPLRSQHFKQDLIGSLDMEYLNYPKIKDSKHPGNKYFYWLTRPKHRLFENRRSLEDVLQYKLISSMDLQYLKGPFKKKPRRRVSQNSAWIRGDDNHRKMFDGVLQYIRNLGTRLKRMFKHEDAKGGRNTKPNNQQDKTQ